MSKDILDVNEMKRIAHEIIEEELEKNGLKVNFFPVTFIEYYNDYVFKKKFKLSEKVDFGLVPLFYKGGFRVNTNNDIVIFLHSTNKVKKIGRNLFKLVENCYHEARHIIQDSFDVYSYEGILIDMENYISKQGFDIEYALHHDKYFCEIDAHLYGVSKAKEYMINYYPKLYDEQKEYIDELEKQYNLDYLAYDLVGVIERVIKIRKKKYDSCSSMIDVPMILDIYLSEKVPVILDIFFNWNCTFKNIREIIKDSRFNELDKRIVSAMFSCKYFLEGIDIDNLAYDELKIVSESLQYINDIYKNQVKLFNDNYSKERIINISHYLEKSKRLIIKK